MRRLLLSLPVLLMPLVAAGQSLAGDPQSMANRLNQKQDLSAYNEVAAAPLAVQTESGNFAARDGSLLQYGLNGSGRASSSDLTYGLGSGFQAHLGVSEHTWMNNRAPRVIGSEVGASYNAGRYTLGLSLGASSAPTADMLPRLLPGATPGVNGLTSFDNSSQLNARGRVAIDGKSGIDLGASVGRIRLLPGNALGVPALDQKALSFGVDHGPLSGSVVGRTMQPTAGIPGNGLNPERRWTSIDLGVTWRLPWQGELSIGAQNLWSSGSPVNTPAGPEPDQSRTPYVQYHQDL